MRYNNNIIDELVEKNDIVSVIGEVVDLKKSGNGYTGLCPFHNEKTPSFHVSEDKQLYHCFGCGAGGNIITFLMSYEDMSFKEALEELAARSGISLPKFNYSKEEEKKQNELESIYSANKQAGIYFYYALKDEKSKKARDELINRALNEETIKKFGIGYSKFYRDDLYSYLKKKGFSDDIIYRSGLAKLSKENFYYDTFFDRIMFPIFNVKGKVIAFGGRAFGENFPKYLNSKETEIFKKSSTLYAMNLAKKSKKDYCLLAEGYMDVISLHQAGFDSAVASLGTALSENQALLIKKYFEKVIICYDSDEAGIKASRRAIPIIKGTGLDVRVLSIDGAKDPDEFIKKYGKEAFQRLIEESENGFLYEISCIEKKYDLTDPAYLVKFYEEIAKKLIALGDKLEIKSYKKKICALYSINLSDMDELLDKIGKNVGIIKKGKHQSLNRHEKKELSLDKAEKIFLQLMLSNENFFEKLKPYIDVNHFNIEINKRIFEILVEYKEGGDFLGADKLVSHFTDIESQKRVANLFKTYILPDEKKDLERLINDCYIVVKRAFLDRMMKEAKSDEDLLDLLKSRKELEKTYILI